MKVKNSLVVLMMAGVLASCGNSSNEDQEVVEVKNDTENVSQTEETIKEDMEKQVEKEALEEEAIEEETIEEDMEKEVKEEPVEEGPVEEAPTDPDFITEDGEYYGDYNQMSDGGINQYNRPQINSWLIEGDVLTVTGTLQINDPDGPFTENKTHKFRLTENTRFVGVGAEGEFEMDIENYLDKGAPANTISVENGFVTQVKFSS